MRAAPSPTNPSEKRARLAGCASSGFQLLRMFWVTELILLLVVLYGLYARWSGPAQWGDAFFYAAVAQVVIAAIPIAGSLSDDDASSSVRYINEGDVSESRSVINQIAGRREKFSLRVFIGSIVTFVIAVLVARV